MGILFHLREKGRSLRGANTLRKALGLCKFSNDYSFIAAPTFTRIINMLQSAVKRSYNIKFSMIRAGAVWITSITP